jgi:hypothetical protein
LGYAGNPPQGANIKPYSPLVFEMELIAIEKATAPTSSMPAQGINP